MVVGFGGLASSLTISSALLIPPVFHDEPPLPTIKVGSVVQSFAVSGALLVPPPTVANLSVFDLADLEHYGLRPYQVDMILAVSHMFSLGYRRVLVVMPTGAGKTRTAHAMIDCANAASWLCQFLVHRRELILQTQRSFAAEGMATDLIMPGAPVPSGLLNTVASVQTLVARLGTYLPPDLCVVDEAQHAVAGSWLKLFDAYGYKPLVGLTATPQRLDGKPLGDVFDAMVIGPSTADLIEMEYLSPFDYYAPDIPDVSHLKEIGGDISATSSAKIMSRPELVGSAVEHYQELGQNMPGIMFASNVKHSLMLTDAFQRAGIRAVHVDGTMKSTERDRAINGYADGKFKLMCNVGLVSEGFDVPATKYIGLARISNSLVFNWQASGRALRLDPIYPRAVICDHAGNALRLGLLPDSDVSWSLDTPVKTGKKNTDAGENPIWQCEECFCLNYSFQKTCSNCGTEKPVKTKAIQEVDGKLTKLEKEELKRREAEKRRYEEGMCRDYADFYHLGVARGYKNPSGWAKIRMRARRR